MKPKVGRLQVAAESIRIPSFWSSVARQEVGKGKGVDNLFLQGEVLQGETCKGFSSSSYHTGVKEDYRSFQFGTMEGIQLVDTVGGERIRSKPEYLVGNPKFGHFEGFGWNTNLSNISKYRQSFRFE